MKWLVGLFVLLSTLSKVSALECQIVNEGLVHEAFIVQEAGTLLTEALSTTPPPRITELQPETNDPQAIWIPGYWGWSHKICQYLWVSGVWRRPPPDHQWVSGYWKNYPEGWVWIRGFWSRTPLENTVYLRFFPPDPIDELVPLSPNNTGDYFWVPGHWRFEEKANQYMWYSGRWEKISPNWIYVPAHYIWREIGFVFNPGFWDWPLDVRGHAFPTIHIDPAMIDTFVYEPKQPLPQLVLMESLYPYWPNYSCLFHTHYFFYYEDWAAWGAVPPWWNWSAWWCLPTQDLWWIWWWWCHPGYPNPSWLNPSLADQIAPPSLLVVKIMGKIQPPPTVTLYGVVGTCELFQAIQAFTGKNRPILPFNHGRLVEIQRFAYPHIPEFPCLEPQGMEKVIEPLPKPFLGLKQNQLQTMPQRTKLPPLPALSQISPAKSPQQMGVVPYTRSVSPYSSSTNEAPEPQTKGVTLSPNEKKSEEGACVQLSIPTERPLPTPYAPITPRAHPTFRADPSLEGEGTLNRPSLPYSGPEQSYNSYSNRRPLSPMETEHHDYMMGRSQFQINPEEPKVYEEPGNYSTHPD
jgi:hypothetical protein